MTAATRSVWIRQRPLLGIASPAWHVQQQVTPGGIVVTSCAVVITPDEIERLADDPATLDSSEDRCPVCGDRLTIIE